MPGAVGNPPSSFYNDLIKWSVHSGLRSTYDATVYLANSDNQYTSALRWNPFQVILNSSVLDYNLADVSCFIGNVRWVYGVIVTVDDTRELYENTIILKINSFASRLGKKPINTEKYDFEDTSVVLGELASIYGGIPSTLYDFSPITGNGKVFAVISGNNLLEEMKKVAQTARADLFIDETGILTSEHWKDNTSSVDVVIPSQAINSASVGKDTSVIPSRIIIRGRFISQFDCGTQVFSSEDWQNPFSPKSYRPHNRQGSIKKCMLVGIGKPQAELIIGGLRAEVNDLRNATYVVTGDGEFSFTNFVKDNTATITIVGPGGTYLSSGNKDFEIKVTGTVKPYNEYRAANSMMGPLRSAFLLPGTVIGRMTRNMTGLPIAEWPEDLLKGPDKDKTADEPDPIRIEMVVDDSDLQNEFGVILEQFENLYIFDYETLFNIAVRKFQEYKMKRNIWKVECSYLPCLALNQVVTFITPDGDNITGLLTDIEVQYENSPKARMSLVVEAFNEIGSTNYTSGNLIVYPELCGSSSGAYASWNDASTNDCYVDMMGGYAAIGGTPVGTAELWQGFDLEIGENYELSYTLILDSGGSITVSVEDSGVHASNTHAFGGTYTLTFIPDEKYNTIHFKSLSGDWYLIRPKLVKFVTR